MSAISCGNLRLFLDYIYGVAARKKSQRFCSAKSESLLSIVFSTLSKGKNVSDFAPQNLSRFFLDYIYGVAARKKSQRFCSAKSESLLSIVFSTLSKGKNISDFAPQNLNQKS